uniref:Uncharacterized protein n=1 Tax=Anguilla anguilla TaxID=7936 RepID=A0A0E9P690_ANGAN
MVPILILFVKQRVKSQKWLYYFSHMAHDFIIPLIHHKNDSRFFSVAFLVLRS